MLFSTSSFKRAENLREWEGEKERERGRGKGRGKGRGRGEGEERERGEKRREERLVYFLSRSVKSKL